MAEKPETVSLQNQTTVPNPTVSPTTTSSQPHTNFVEVMIHTAKCDLCEKHNKRTVYRCMECGQHVCSQCWKKSGDGTHVFGGGSQDASGLNRSDMIKIDSGDGKSGHENASKTRARRRVHVISDDDDDDDDDLPVLKPVSTTNTAEAIEATNQQNRRTHAIMNGGYQQGYGSNLWPMVPVRGPPVSRPAVPTAHTSLTDSPNGVMQRNPHLHGDENNPQHERIGGPYNSLRRQQIYVSTGDQETDLPARRPPQQYISNQQANRYAHNLAPPANYRPQPGSDADNQATNPRNRLAFVSQRNDDNHQAPRPSQASVSRQQAVHSVPLLSQPSFSIFERHVQTAANINQMSARDRQIAYLKQREQAYNKAKLIDARDRQALSSQQSARLAANRDQVATHNHPAFISNRLESFAANHEEMMAAREHQQAYLSRQQANRQTSGAARISVPYQPTTQLSPHPDQATLSPMHAASLAPRQSQGSSPEVIEAADALLSYAGVEQSERRRFHLERAENRDSYLLSPASQSENPSSARPKSSSTSTTLVSPSGTAGAHSLSPHNLASILNPGDADADSAQARLEKNRRRLAGLQPPSDTRPFISDAPASERSHPSPRHAALQPDSGPWPADSSAVKSNGASFRLVQPHPGSTVPMSDRAAAYLDQWKSGRAALSSNSRGTATDVPARQPERPHSTIPTVHVQNSTSGEKEPREVAEASTQTSNTPDSVIEGANDADFVMGSPALEIPEDKEPRSSELRTPEDNIRVVVKRRDAEKHPRSETSDEGKTSKEHKASDDIDVVDARKRDIKVEHPDDDDDMETTTWNELDIKKPIDKQRDTNAEPGLDRILKRGVAYVKKPKRKGKSSRTLRHLP